jgi:glucose-6-phosphate 1-epimerase
MSHEHLEIQGQPAVRLRLSGGDAMMVALHGGHILSWCTADGIERLYLSPRAVFDGRTAIRGGVPVCFPQFNTRGPLPKHGFARNLPWALEPQGPGAPDTLLLALRDSEATRALWPAQFEARLRVQLAPGRLRVGLEVVNSGASPWTFTAALHTYLRVDDVTQARLDGLAGAAAWDAVADLRYTQDNRPLRFGEEFDRVFSTPPGANGQNATGAWLTLAQPAGRLAITHSATATETVVWNPGPHLCATLADMPADGWRHMLCVEAACIDAPVHLAPGAPWSVWQALAVLP